MGAKDKVECRKEGSHAKLGRACEYDMRLFPFALRQYQPDRGCSAANPRGRQSKP